MKMRIKVHETNGDHHGHIEWIEKLDLRYLPLEDRRKQGVSCGLELNNN